MRENKISLKGIYDLLKRFTSWLKTPEERELFASQAKKEESKAIKIKTEAIVNALKEIVVTKSLELENLNKTIELYEKLGYSEEKIQKLVGSKLERLSQIHEDLKILGQFVDSGIILDARVRQDELP